MSTISTSEGLATLINFLVGGTASATDAASGVQKALANGTQTQRVLAGIGASADVVGTAASAGQMLSQFAANSTEAGLLLGGLAKRSGQVGLLLNVRDVLNTIREQGTGSITSGQLDALAGSALAAAAVAAAPEAAIALGVLAAGMTIVGAADSSSSHSLSNALRQLRSIVAPIADKMSESEKATFSASLSDTIHVVFSGGTSPEHTSADAEGARQHKAKGDESALDWLQQVDALRSPSFAHPKAVNENDRGASVTERAAPHDDYATAALPDLATSSKPGLARSRFH